MSALFTRLTATAARLIKKYGALVTWNSIDAGAVDDPNKPWKPGASGVTQRQVYLLFLDSNRINLEFAAFISGTEIPEGYLRAIIAGNVGFTPTLKDTFVLNNLTYSVEWLDPTQPNGTPIVWKMGVKAP